MPDPDPAIGPRSAQEVINHAIRENRSWEWLLFILTAACAVVGLTVVSVACYRNEGWLAFSGTVVTALFWPAMRYANRIREGNIRIRMFELALSQSDKPGEVAKLLREAMGDQKGKS